MSSREKGGSSTPYGERRLYTRSELNSTMAALGHTVTVTRGVPQRTAALLAEKHTLRAQRDENDQNDSEP